MLLPSNQHKPRRIFQGYQEGEQADLLQRVDFLQVCIPVYFAVACFYALTLDRLAKWLQNVLDQDEPYCFYISLPGPFSDLISLSGNQ